MPVRPRARLHPLWRALVLPFLLVSLTAAPGCQDSEAKLGEHMARGDTYLEEKKFSEAVLEYKNVLQIDPNHGPAHYGLARAYLGNNQLRQAYWELQETVRLDPANVDAQLQYGQFLLFGKEEDLLAAVQRADEVIAKDPARWEAWVLKGRALETLKRVDEAAEALGKAVEVAPEEAAPLLLLANFRRGQGQKDLAEPLYRKLTEVEPGLASYAALGAFLASDRDRDAEAEKAYREALEKAEDDRKADAHALLANFYYSRDRFEEAEATLEQGVEKHPGNLELLYALARFYNARGDSARADQMILEATKANPSDPKPFLVLSSYRGLQGDLEGALAAAESALAADAEHRPARLRKAELLVDMGFRRDDAPMKAEGRAIVDAVLSADAADPEARLVKSKIELADGNVADAVADLRRAIDARPDWAQAHFLLGSALYLQRDLNGARAEVTRALELDADMTDAQQMMARIHATSGEHQLAVEVGRRLLQRKPEDAALRILVAQSLVRLARFDEAVTELEAIPEAERDSEAHYALGRIAFLKNDPAGARKQFEQAHQKDPYRHEVLRALFDLDLRENRIPESSERLKKALSARPDDAKIVQLLGEVALYSGNPAEAESHFTRAVELNPNDLGAYEALARYLMVAGRPREVLSTYEKALERNPQSATLHLVVGSLYELQSRLPDAIERYEEAVRINPELAVAKNNLAYLLAETGGNLDRALDLAQEAKEALPENPNAADTLGWVLYKKNVPSAAIGYLREAERGFPPENPQLGIVRHHLAMAYEANGEPEQAREVLAQALRDLETLRGDTERPDPPWAAEIRAMLERLGGAPVAAAAPN
jgi:tetratricopeptide (TPR) repeat protein